MKKKSFWSHYMLYRYAKDFHPALVPLAPNATIVWKRMWHVRQDVGKHMH